MIWILSGALLTLAGLIVVLVKIQMHRREMKNYDAAAKRIIQEECLNYAIKNPIHTKGARPVTQKIMICLKPLKSKQKGFVFDPEKRICIGRYSEENEICLQDMSVSGVHCSFMLYQNHIWLRDLQSANGTIVRRGLWKTWILHNEQMIVKSGDQIQVGCTVFRIVVFYCDLMSE